jgi:hypothetical protein
MTAVQMPATSANPGTYTATVYAPDGVLFVAATDCPRELAARVVEYIRGRCDDVLWPSDAMAVRGLIEDGRLEAAIAAYFSRVGERWDTERLELGGVTP